MIEKVTRYIKLLKKYNTLETEYEVLRDYVKENSFNKDNKRLRLKVKEYKELLNKQPGESSQRKKFIVNCK